ncbi:hypothetical protein [Maribacter luteus]|uniref:hypothetical protein n=1 Tax=Maribacter luteus TaxID=2594478 RepID=UPI002493B25B|nr:hypothetical protein [Maribacter luteus]
MEAHAIKAREQKLKQEIKKSFANVRLSKKGRLTMADKRKLKNVAASSVQRFLKYEIKKTTTKTYDWYFFKEEGKLYHIEVSRNNLLQNRYFIVDYKQIPIQAETAFASTYGQQNIQQYDISSKEIGDIISSSKKIFADMMKITVSEKEDAKIYRAFDNVDEKKIITVTVGLPLAIIASAEAVPLMVMASKSSTASTLTSSLGRTFAVNSGRTALINGSMNFGSQYLSTGISKNEWGLFNLKTIDVADVGASAVFSNWGSAILSSEFNLTFNEGFESNDLTTFSKNLALSRASKKVSSSFVSTVGKPMEQFAGTVGALYNYGGQFTISTLISTAKKNNSQKDSKE